MNEGFVFDEKNHLYFYDGKPMTGCTTILGILAKPALIPWAAKMAVEHATANIQSGRSYSEDELATIFTDAKNAHRKKKEDAAEAGTDLHALVEEYVTLMIRDQDGMPVEMNIENNPIQPFIDWARKNYIRFIATETKLYSKELWVAGTVDLVFEKLGKRFVGDIKTYKKLWDRVPLIQCAGYALMWEEMHERAGIAPAVDLQTGEATFIEISEPTDMIDGYCVICLPKERPFKEAEDVMWSFDPQAEREAFISAVKIYRYLNQ